MYSAICIETNLLLGIYLVFIFFALFAYFKVFNVSSNYALAGLTLAIIIVLQLPPKLSLSILVNLLSLYGTKNPFLFLSPKAFIQLAKANKDLFILAPSFNLIPLFSVTVPLSDPAKSIRLNFPTKVSYSIFLTFGEELITI